MTETTRRVKITLTFATDAEADHIRRAVDNNLLDHLSDALESISVHTFDLAEDDDLEPTVCLVLTGDGVRWCDTEAAETVGPGVGGVVVELPVTADYREADR